MARPRSIFEQFTSASLPPPDLRDRFHMVTQGETLMSVANVAFSIQEYDPDRWRSIGLANNVENPITFDQDFLGRTIKIPGLPLPDFSS